MAAEAMAAGRVEDKDRQGQAGCYRDTARAASFINEASERESAGGLPEA